MKNIWSWNQNLCKGQSIKEAYHIIISGINFGVSKIYDVSWNKLMPRKVSLMAWASHNDHLQARSPICVLMDVGISSMNNTYGTRKIVEWLHFVVFYQIIYGT